MARRRTRPENAPELVVKIPRDRALRVGVVADTHARPHPSLREHLLRLAPDRILHAGDIGDKRVIAELEEIAPVTAVRGNIDPPGHWPDTIGITFETESRVVLKAMLAHIVLYGPKVLRQAADQAKQQNASLIVCGHSHVPFIGTDRGLTIFNPGSAGPRRFTLPILFGVLTLTPDRLDLEHFNCETGEPWLPPA